MFLKRNIEKDNSSESNLEHFFQSLLRSVFLKLGFYFERIQMFVDSTRLSKSFLTGLFEWKVGLVESG